MGEKYLSNHRGQVTLFIILALVIVVVSIAIYMFYPQLEAEFGLSTKSPSEFIQVCMEDDMQENLEKISLQGGSLDPEHFIWYDNEKVEYLCFTNQNYEPCVIQQPFLKQHIEEELKTSLSSTAQECFESLRNNYKKQGYEVNLNLGESNLELFPEKVIATFDHTLTLTKEDSTRYQEFSIVVNNNLYELVSITNSILNFEATYGDSETTAYMNFYHDLKVEKKKHTDSTTVYILTDRDTGEKFQFASRSVPWPSGY